ncbi:hypothetical protein [Carnobacterium antarcticum]|uniref:Phage protein n=1 Tax=Carnobacterium antarcticum TaxID=2126436 RepID=A0ABW4NNS6_9LACT|nr:hypothetical protein [Carnobacterium sp. CP1]ALV20777.1 hypothetical protein NY10_152 [Carnobacterium sp. CP1]
MADNLITLLKEFEGIIGTLLGIVVGTVISYIQNNTGKIKIFLTESKYYFTESNLDGNDRVIYIEKKDGTNSHDFDFASNIEIYNSSNTRKILRNIKLFIETTNGIEYKKLFVENNNFFDVLNVEAKSIVRYHIYAHEDRFAETESIFLNEIIALYIEFENEKGKKQRYKI